MKREWLWLAAAIILLAAGFMVQKTGLLDQQGQVTVVTSDCDLRQGACNIEMAGQLLEFVIDPAEIQILKPLTIALKFPENAVIFPKKVSVEFEGVNMDMGYNRIWLEPQDDNVFQGQGMLPACTAETMYWRIHLLVQDASGMIDFQFQLTTENPRVF